MADEISQAIQIIRLEFDGLRFGMNVTGATAKQVKNLTIFLYALLTREKLQGRTSLKNMISKDGNLQVLKIKETDDKKLSKVAKKYGLLYSKLPDINKDDGMMEILFHTEATPRINALIEKLGSGSIEDLVDYVKNGKDGDFEKITDYLQQNNVLRSDKSITPSEEKKSQINSISRNLDYNAKLKDDCLVDVTVAKKLYIEENLTQLKMRIPNTYGAGARYVWIDKDDAIPINDGKTFYVFFKKDEEYKILDKDDNVVEKVKGLQLKNTHYDTVSDEVKYRAMRQQQINKRRKNKSKSVQINKSKSNLGTSSPEVRIKR